MVAVGGAPREIGGRSPGRAVVACRREDADGIANGCLARHERSAGSGVTLVQLTEAVLDSCRYDSFVKARPRVMRKLGRRQPVVLTMRHGSDYPFELPGLGETKRND